MDSPWQLETANFFEEACGKAARSPPLRYFQLSRKRLLSPKLLTPAAVAPTPPNNHGMVCPTYEQYQAHIPSVIVNLESLHFVFSVPSSILQRAQLPSCFATHDSAAAALRAKMGYRRSILVFVQVPVCPVFSNPRNLEMNLS